MDNETTECKTYLIIAQRRGALAGDGDEQRRGRSSTAKLNFGSVRIMWLYIGGAQIPRQVLAILGSAR
jgi:hypothetical protein